MAFRRGGQCGLAALTPQGEWRGITAGSAGFPGTLDTLLPHGARGLDEAFRRLVDGVPVDPDSVDILPPLRRPPKILCVGLNYADHAAENAVTRQAYPTLFSRFASSLVGHGAPIERPRSSEQLDFEGELVAIIGTGGRHISRQRALDHVAGWSIFNDASVRDYQLKTPQWTVGKNFDRTGAFGPWFVTADELPRGATGLTLETRLNGTVVQSASTADLLFDVATLVEIISEAMTLESGDLIVTGTPGGIGLFRKPQLWMKNGDVVEVEVERIGILRNPIRDEAVEGEHI
jgi:2-keto-4-pentenoate hydratase/2-oxohepta-3-ene-1,7-dioic acid hydratase in catechol pathway